MDNFNDIANVDDGSCSCYGDDCFGCTDFSATNFNDIANIDDGSCNYIILSEVNFLKSIDYGTQRFIEFYNSSDQDIYLAEGNVKAIIKYQTEFHYNNL